MPNSASFLSFRFPSAPRVLLCSRPSHVAAPFVCPRTASPRVAFACTNHCQYPATSLASQLAHAFTPPRWRHLASATCPRHAPHHRRQVHNAPRSLLPPTPTHALVPVRHARSHDATPLPACPRAMSNMPPPRTMLAPSQPLAPSPSTSYKSHPAAPSSSIAATQPHQHSSSSPTLVATSNRCIA